MKSQALEILLLLSVFTSLAVAGLSANSGGGHGQYGPPTSAHNHRSSGAHQNRIKGGIGDGYIYPVKSYKLIIQNGGSQSAAPKHQGAKVKIIKVVRQNKPSGAQPGHPASVKTIKLIRLKSGAGKSGYSNSRHGWQ